MAITINTQAEFDKLKDEHGNVYLREDLILNCDIKAWDIKAFNIDAFDIKALDIEAWDIKAFNIDACNIDANDIDYFAACFAHGDITCTSIKGRRENSKHFSLEGGITIKDDKKELKSNIKDLEDKLKKLREKL